MQANVYDIIANGYPMNALLSQIHDTIVNADFVMSGLNKALICEKIASVESCLIDGASETLQLLDLCSFIMRRCSTDANKDQNNATTAMNSTSTLH